MKLTNAKFFVDSNILLYLTDDTSSKNLRAKELISTNPLISVQFIFECLNGCLKKLKFNKETSVNFAKYLFKTCTVVGEKKDTGIFAIELFSRFSLQSYDAKIVATAIDAGCSILYSEDMQNGLVIDERLTVVNPFL